MGDPGNSVCASRTSGHGGWRGRSWTPQTSPAAPGEAVRAGFPDLDGSTSGEPGSVARFEAATTTFTARFPAGWLPDVVEELVARGLLSVAEPYEYVWQRMPLTNAGQAEYQALRRRLRQTEMSEQVPAVEHGSTQKPRLHENGTVQIPAGHRVGRYPSTSFR